MLAPDPEHLFSFIRFSVITPPQTRVVRVHIISKITWHEVPQYSKMGGPFQWKRWLNKLTKS